jgi:hypothetical protein
MTKTPDNEAKQPVHPSVAVNLPIIIRVAGLLVCGIFSRPVVRIVAGQPNRVSFHRVR